MRLFHMNGRCLAFLTMVTALFALSGCAQYQWMKPGATEQDFQRDNYACMRDSLQQAPPVYQTIDPTGGMPVQQKVRTTCRQQQGVTDCNQERKNIYRGRPYTTDLNESMRNSVTSACLNAAGWQLVRIESR
jgi:hypothetical protein